jgi:hypothetical protein
MLVGLVLVVQGVAAAGGQLHCCAVAVMLLLVQAGTGVLCRAAAASCGRW